MSRELLLALFGNVIAGKITEKPTRHQLPGKHYGTNHNQKAEPAGSKLFRKFYGKNLPDAKGSKP